MRLCKLCGSEKDESAFTASELKREKPRCKECVKRTDEERRARYIAEHMAQAVISCRICKNEKAPSEFDQSELGKKSPRCKVCGKEYSHSYYEKNSDRIKDNVKQYAKDNAEKVKEWHAEYYQENIVRMKAANKRWRQEHKEKKASDAKRWAKNNPEKVKESSKRWRKNNPEKRKAILKRYEEANPEKVAECHLKSVKKWQSKNADKLKAKQRERYKTDPVYRNKMIVSSMVKRMIKAQGGFKGGKSFLDYVDWTPEELWKHLVECMKQPGNEWMTPDNQGPYNPETHHLPGMRTWQLDHIIPQSDLPYDSMIHPNFKKCWALNNLRPLDAKQNVMDGVNRTRHSKQENGTKTMDALESYDKNDKDNSGG